MICCPDNPASCLCCHGCYPTPDHPSQTCWSGFIGCLTCGFVLTVYPREKPQVAPIPVQAIKSEFVLAPPTQSMSPSGQMMMNPQQTIELLSVKVPINIAQGATLSVQKSNGESVIFQVPLGTVPGSVIQIQS
jgi:hypothetical protein